MAKYVMIRILQVVPVIVGTTLILFTMLYVVPGDPVRMLTGEKAMSPKQYELVSKELGLDRPVHEQYVRYMGALLQGDLGTSYQRGLSVVDILKEKYQNSVRLALAAIAVEVVFGVLAGILAARWRRSFLDTLITVSSIALLAVPVFWFGMMLQIYFGVQLSALPISGMGDGSLSYYVLPAVTLAASSTAVITRLMRAQMIEVLRAPFIQAAYAKGLTDSEVILRHAVKNASLPAISFIAIDLGALMGGAVLTESIFNWPGVGYEIFNAIGQRDHPIVFGGVLVLVVIYVLVNLVADLLYAVLDPRIRYQTKL